MTFHPPPPPLSTPTFMASQLMFYANETKLDSEGTCHLANIASHRVTAYSMPHNPEKEALQFAWVICDVSSWRSHFPWEKRFQWCECLPMYTSVAVTSNLSQYFLRRVWCLQILLCCGKSMKALYACWRIESHPNIKLISVLFLSHQG